MRGTAREQATTYLQACAVQIAPHWVEHYDQKLPPAMVLTAFDQAVANVVEAYPRLATEFGHPVARQDLLTSDLLDLVIQETHREVRLLKAHRDKKRVAWEALTSEERITHLEKRKATSLAQQNQAEADAIEALIQAEEDDRREHEIRQAKQERLAYLRARRDEREAAQVTPLPAQPLEDIPPSTTKQSRLDELRARRDKRAAEAARAEAGRTPINTDTKAKLLAFRERSALRKAEQGQRDEAERRQREEDAAQERQAEQRLEQFFDDALAELRKSDRLTNDQGSVTRIAAQEFLAALPNTVVARWPEHGGQAVDSVLLKHLFSAPKALFQGVDLSSGEWDAVQDDGTISRIPDLDALETLTTARLHSVILSNARPDYTFEQHKAWDETELRESFLQLIRDTDLDLKERARHDQELATAARSLAEWQQLHAAPSAFPYGVSPAGAEQWCCDWLTHMGLQKAAVTQLTGDGGIDVVSLTHIAQVKHYKGSVSIAEIRELAGVAAIDGRTPIFMTSGKYPTQAEAFADKADMLLFTYDVLTGEVVAHTSQSKDTMVAGFVTKAPEAIN